MSIQESIERILVAIICPLIGFGLWVGSTYLLVALFGYNFTITLVTVGITINILLFTILFVIVIYIIKYD